MRTTTAWLLATAVAVGGCSAPAEPERGPRLEVVPCPDDVEVLVVPPHACGYVVPDPESTTRIFVVTIEPPTSSDLSPVLETGVDLGMAPAYGGLAPIAQRTGRRVVIVDLPGTGHSTPSLDCPEVESIGDAEARGRPQRLADAVRACRTRLEGEGADVDALSPSRLGESLAAVMTALDEDRWVVMGHGSTAEAGRQVALAHPERVEALVVDSLVAEPVEDLGQLVQQVADACRADGECLSRYGDPVRDWRQALRSLRRDALEVEVPATTVSVDDVDLVRGVRWLTGPASGASRLPAFLHEAASRTPGPELRLFAETLSVAPPLCVGYVPKCETDQRLVIGATLSAQCPTAAGLAAWAAPCRAWGVGLGTAAPAPLTGVPTLAVHGALDPFAARDLIDARLDQLLPDAHRVELVSGGHNVLGEECVREVRNAWLAGDLHAPPGPDPCLTEPPDFL